jgi:Uma2 family endonuclease
VRLQAPVSLDDESEPEPDLVVVPGHPGDYRASHPAHPALVVEVAESSLEFDRTRKGSLYARAAVPDYWIVNLVDGVVEIYRDPEPDASATFGWRYRSVTRLAPPAAVAPLGFSGERIAVAVATGHILTQRREVLRTRIPPDTLTSVQPPDTVGACRPRSP